MVAIHPSLSHPNFRKAQTFFDEVIEHRLKKDSNFRKFYELPRNAKGLIVVAHINPQSISYLKAVQEHFSLIALIPKPKSIDKITYEYLENAGFPFVHCTRDELAKISYPKPQELIERVGDKIFGIVDIGAYFAPIPNHLDSFYNRAGAGFTIHEQYNGIDFGQVTYRTFRGVVEDTKNGYDKWRKIENRKIPALPVFGTPKP